MKIKNPMIEGIKIERKLNRYFWKKIGKTLIEALKLNLRGWKYVCTGLGKSFKWIRSWK